MGVVPQTAGVFGYFLREAQSDVSGAKFLSPYGGQQVQLDYALSASVPASFQGNAFQAKAFQQLIGEVDSFITPQNSPNTASWPAGDYRIGIDVVAADQISVAVEIWSADASGNEIEQIGSAPAQAGPGNLTFVIAGAEISAGTTGRLKLKVLAQNNDGTSSHTLSILCSVSNLVTPIAMPLSATNAHNTFRRGRFLSRFLRKGEDSLDWGPGGVSLR